MVNYSNAKDAALAHYEARQHGAKDQDVPMNQEWVRKKHSREHMEYIATNDHAMDAQSREGSDRSAIIARRKIMEILGEDEPAPRTRTPQRGNRSRQTAPSGLSMDDLMDGSVDDLIQNDPELRALHENQSSFGNVLDPYGESVDDDLETLEESVGSGGWYLTEGEARIKSSGTTVSVWYVTNDNGMELKTPFRLEEVADQIARILNKTGNVNDPRITKLTETYRGYLAARSEVQKYTALVRKQGKTQYTPKLNEARKRLADIKFRLGI